MKLPALPAIPEFHLPAWVARLNRKLPQWPHALPLCLGLNLGLAWKALPEELGQLCDGKIVRIVLEDGGSEAWLIGQDGEFRPVWEPGPETIADVSFRGELHAFLKLLTRQEDPDTLFFNRQIAIEGDTELGLAIKNLLDALEWPPASLSALAERLGQWRPKAFSASRFPPPSTP